MDPAVARISWQNDHNRQSDEHLLRVIQFGSRQSQDLPVPRTSHADPAATNRPEQSQSKHTASRQAEPPRIEVNAPDGGTLKVINPGSAQQKTPQDDYEPPSLERVAEVVSGCERSIEGQVLEDDESPVGVLLREASMKLYHNADASDKRKPIFPYALLAEILTESRVRSSLRFESVEATHYNPDECIKRICGDKDSGTLGEFARVFAVLLLCDKPQAIFKFFDNGVSDKCFPFVQGERTVCPRSRDGGNKEFHLNWRNSHCELFVELQWRVFLPRFSDEFDHQEFDEEAVMPWHDYHFRAPKSSSTASSDGGIDAPGGGHSDVSRVFIHVGHCNFNGTGQHSTSQGPGHLTTYAVKKLRTRREAEFKSEVSMLRELGGTRHTVKLLTTFRHGRTYCLLFPWAECDLLAYWEDRPLPHGISSPLIEWAINQCCGLVSALKFIHDPGPGTAVLDPQKNPLFGRHGDIKPENILWYKRCSDGPHPMASGDLVLSDFGLSSLNHKDTRSKVVNDSILHTPTYAAPELALPGNVISPRIDIWALGCVFLEYVTWIVYGPGAVSQFQRARLSPFLGQNYKTDIFWEVQDPEHPTDSSLHVTVVKPQVLKWIEQLRQHPRATKFIQDFLDIIERHMLIVKKEERAQAEDLMPMFARLKESCDRNQSYYTKPARPVQNSAFVQLPEPQQLKPEAQAALRRATVAISRYSQQTPRVELLSTAVSATYLEP